MPKLYWVFKSILRRFGHPCLSGSFRVYLYSLVLLNCCSSNFVYIFQVLYKVMQIRWWISKSKLNEQSSKGLKHPVSQKHVFCRFYSYTFLNYDDLIEMLMCILNLYDYCYESEEICDKKTTISEFLESRSGIVLCLAILLYTG